LSATNWTVIQVIISTKLTFGVNICI